MQSVLNVATGGAVLTTFSRIVRSPIASTSCHYRCYRCHHEEAVAIADSSGARGVVSHGRFIRRRFGGSRVRWGRVRGAASDGAASDGAASDGATSDGTASDGTAFDGPTSVGASPGGAVSADATFADAARNARAGRTRLTHAR